MRRSSIRLLLLMAAVGLTGLATSCSDSTSPETEYGTLQLRLVDAPAKAAGIESLVVVFEEVLVHKSADADSLDEEWFTVMPDTLPVEDRTFDLLDLVNGAWGDLGRIGLEAGHYTQIRLMLEDVILTVDGVEQDLFIPSGDQTGIKLTGGFTVDPDVVTTLTLDFDVDQSLHETPEGSGNYILRPTIRLVQTVLSGTVSGMVEPLDIGAVVHAIHPASGDTVTTTMVDPVTGGYVIQALLEDTYDVTVSAAGYDDSTLTGIVVTAGQDTPDVDFVLSPTGN